MYREDNRTDLLFIIHCPIAAQSNISGSEKNNSKDTYILLLFPVPRSIMMCLFLQYVAAL